MPELSRDNDQRHALVGHLDRVRMPELTASLSLWSLSCSSQKLKRTLAYPKLRKRIPPEQAAAFASWVRDHASLGEDPASPPPVGSRDPDDDYLLALAINRRAYLVTGDKDLLVLSDNLPILTPAQFATKLRETT